MRAREDTHLGGYRSDFVVSAAVDVLARAQDMLSNVLAQLRLIDVDNFLFRVLLDPRGENPGAYST